MLGGYTGVVVSDGYSGYNILSNATRAGCWAHARRKWVEAMPNGATKENALRTFIFSFSINYLGYYNMH